MLDNKLKYLIIGVILLSVLIVLGALLFTFLQRFKNPPLVKQQINATQKPSPSAHQSEQKSKIRIIYPSAEATRSSVPLRKPAAIPKIEASGSSIQGFGPAPKNLQKP